MIRVCLIVFVVVVIVVPFCCSFFAVIVIAVVIGVAVYLNSSSPSQQNQCHVVADEFCNDNRKYFPCHLWFCVSSTCSFYRQLEFRWRRWRRMSMPACIYILLVHIHNDVVIKVYIDDKLFLLRLRFSAV